jgi:hypothetical protein
MSRDLDPTPARALEPNHRLIDALEFAHTLALRGQHHTAPYWRVCEFFPCNSFDAIIDAARADAADAAQQEVARLTESRDYYMARAVELAATCVELRAALEEAIGEASCPTTSGGTEGKWCLNHDTPMADAGICVMVKGWLSALARPSEDAS